MRHHRSREPPSAPVAWRMLRPMSLWEALLGNKDFWRDYLVSAGTETVPNVSIAIDLPVGHFKLRVSMLHGYESALALHAGGEAETLGHVDASFMDDLLRWDEREVLVAALGKEPGPPWAIDLLLLRYVALTPGIAALYVDALHTALALSGVFTTAEMEAIVRRLSERMRPGLRWELDANERGWVAVGEGVHSMRRRGAEFPFEAWSRLLAAAEKLAAH